MSGAANAQLSAVIACHFMRRYGYQPASLINVGVGTYSAEYKIWEWLLPNTELVGVDPRGRHFCWPARYIKAAVAEESGKPIPYCGKCKSITCDKIEEHGRAHVVDTITIDDIAATMKPPFFLWLDCEGAELSALRGAVKTLKDTRWISVEFCKVDRFGHNGEAYSSSVDGFLRENGFRLHFENPQLDDRLYRKR